MHFWLWAAPIATTVINVLTSWFTHEPTPEADPPSGTLHTIARSRPTESTHLEELTKWEPGAHFVSSSYSSGLS